MIKAVKFVSIPVKDQDRALRFYTEKLGFQLLTDQPYDEHQRWIELQIPGAETKVVLFMADGQETWIGKYSNITFMTDNVQKTYEEMSARGVEFQGPPKKEDWGTFAIFKDLDGTTFLLSSK